MTHTFEPLFCSLRIDDAAAQAMEWADLLGHTVAVEPLRGGVALTFRIGMADDVEDLASREAECCGFLSITTTRNAESVLLEITSDHPDAAPVIDAIAGIGAP
jgi:hypothetical protein